MYITSRIKEVSESQIQVVEVDGSYMYRKKQQLSSAGFVAVLPAPTPPLTGWEQVTSENSATMSKKNIK